MSQQDAKDTPVADDAQDSPATDAPDTATAEADAQQDVGDVEIAEPEEAADPTPDEIIADLEARLAEMEDRNLRLRADYDNLRKRATRDVTDARALGRTNTIEAFLPVLDHFGMAMAMIDKGENVDMIKQGMQMIHAEFERGFENLGVKRLDTVGKAFDPHLHEAMSAEPSDDVPDQHIIREWTPGYVMGERLLRAAKVVVSSGPAPDTTDDDAPADADADA